MEILSVVPLDWLAHLWPYLLVALVLTLNLWASGHAVLHKRDTRAATAWMGFIRAAPLLGPALYGLLGINRIRRLAEAGKLRKFSPQTIDHFLRSLSQEHRLTMLVDMVPVWGELGADDVMLETLYEVTGAQR